MNQRESIVLCQCIPECHRKCRLVWNEQRGIDVKHIVLLQIGVELWSSFFLGYHFSFNLENELQGRQYTYLASPSPNAAEKRLLFIRMRQKYCLLQGKRFGSNDEVIVKKTPILRTFAPTNFSNALNRCKTVGRSI